MGLCKDLSYTQRIQLHVALLNDYLPEDYEESVGILVGILGPENPEETDVFKKIYWIMPIGKYIELYGLEYYKTSIHAIAEITKRNTGEHAIRPYIRKHPAKTIKIMMKWQSQRTFIFVDWLQKDCVLSSRGPLN
ncbi:MAG: hypothetical protein ACJA01_002825 [Saprospiraceae bacterium]|jgi:hypothetical protein